MNRYATYKLLGVWVGENVTVVNVVRNLLISYFGPRSDYFGRQAVSYNNFNTNMFFLMFRAKIGPNLVNPFTSALYINPHI